MCAIVLERLLAASQSASQIELSYGVLCSLDAAHPFETGEPGTDLDAMFVLLAAMCE